MTDHLAVLEELAKKWRSEFTGGEDRELKEIGYDACLLDCADELDAAIALMRGQSWQPIETAPKVWGERIDVWSRGERVADAYWGIPTYEGKEPGWVVTDGHDCDGPVDSRVIAPTHWQPRPAPPQQEPAE